MPASAYETIPDNALRHFRDDADARQDFLRPVLVITFDRVGSIHESHRSIRAITIAYRLAPGLTAEMVSRDPAFPRWLSENAEGLAQ